MNLRERFHNLMNFQPVDRIPMIEWAPWWHLTTDRWKREGLVVELQEGLWENESLELQFGLDLHMQSWIGCFTDKTPRAASFGAPIVQSMEEYFEIKPTLYPDDPLDHARMRRIAERQKRGEVIAWITLDGMFWGPRNLLGIEPHLYAFYDDPELMHRINQDITAYNIRVYEQVCEYFVPDFMTIAEDMSYNNGPMISEAQFNEFVLPYYQQMIPPMKNRGTRIFVDSDGDISLALPWFANAGVEGILPLERQAGVDLMKLRDQYPNFLFIGHYDKMVMPLGEEAMRAEFERLLPVMRQGGFIPSVDHQTPPGVSLENYEIYLRLLREYCEKAAQK